MMNTRTRSALTRLGILAVFTLLLTFSTAFAQDANTVSLEIHPEIGPYLVAADGRPLYTHTEDELEACTGDCLNEWPPYTAEAGATLTTAEGLPGQLTTMEREDGTLQIAYAGEPLYFYHDDTAEGDQLHGHGVNSVWFAARPADVWLHSNEELGEFLIAGDGLTLYRFTVDHAGESYCYEGCFKAWPPLLDEDGQLLVDPRLSGELSTFERRDGGIHVMYNGHPLYYFFNDTAFGQTTGQGVKDVWFVVPPDIEMAESESH